MVYGITSNTNYALKCAFSPEYFEGKLYKLSISVKHEYLSNVTINLSLCNIYMDKYSFPDIEKPMLLVDECKEYIWINGNRQINIICGIDGAGIFYKDLYIQKVKEEREKKKLEKKLMENKKNI